jgi:NAD(P)H-dependent flavin oxidoreductase YrpB (nitropropane dioxygenase family)
VYRRTSSGRVVPQGHPPPEFVAALHEADLKVWEQVGSVAAAQEAVDSGIDAIVAQGTEAGGGTRFVASNEAFAHSTCKRRLVEAAGTETRLWSVYGPNMPHFNPMRVLDVGLARDFAGREEAAPKDLETQPIIGLMRLAGETIPFHRFTSFVPTPDTDGQIDELPFLAGQGVGLLHDVAPVGQIIEGMMTEAASVLSAVNNPGGP